MISMKLLIGRMKEALKIDKLKGKKRNKADH